MSEVAIGGGGLKTSDKVWSFSFFFNPSLRVRVLKLDKSTRWCKIYIFAK